MAELQKKSYIQQGDCIDLMKDIPNKSVDLIVTDPPYLINYKTNRRKDKTHKFCGVIANDDNTQLIGDYIEQCYRIMKDNTARYMFCNFDKVEIFKIELQKYFKIKNMIIWEKNNHTAGDLYAQFGKSYEIIFLVNKGRKKFNGKRINDIWKFDKVATNQLIHQNQKPVELLEQCILKHSNKGDIVFDGFMGSGSTIVACINTDRNYIGFELDEQYFDIAKKRIKDAESKQIDDFLEKEDVEC